MSRWHKIAIEELWPRPLLIFLGLARMEAGAGRDQECASRTGKRQNGGRCLRRVTATGLRMQRESYGEEESDACNEK
jgi:hypothetical protein